MSLDIATTKQIKIGTKVNNNVASITDMSKFVKFKRLINLERVEIIIE